MPGIVGLISKMPSDQAQLTVQRMEKAMSRESYYLSGAWADNALGVYIAWTAHRGSFCDRMPLVNENKDVTLIFSGEEFSDPGTTERLRAKGHSCQENDASYLVHLYEEDSGFPTGLNGRFHGVLIDKKRNVIMLFNDRYGLHRLYYYESKHGFYFAAEAKALLAACQELRDTDMQSMAEYVSCGCVLENRTLFSNIRVLPPGSAWIFDAAGVSKKQTYFIPQEWENQIPLTSEEYYEQLRNIFSTRLKRYFNANQLIGISLTGGLDTRMIMAWHRASPGSLPCYTFGGMFRDCMDVVLARRVAAVSGQVHQTIGVGNGFLSKFADYAERTVFLTDGCLNVRHAADLYANQQARDIAPIRVTGNYGGEVLRGIRAFKPENPPFGLFQQEVGLKIQTATKTYEKLLDCHPVSFVAFRQTPWHHYGLQALEQTQLCLRTPFLDNELVRTVFRAPASARATEAVSVRLILDGNPAMGHVGTDRGPFKTDSFPSFGVISRRMLNILTKAEYAYDYGMPQWVATIDHILSPLRLERFVLGRQKFCHFRVWYRDNLSSYVRDILLDSRTRSRPYIEFRELEKIVHGHLKGNRNYTTAIHKVLTLELFHRLFIDNVVPQGQ